MANDTPVSTFEENAARSHVYLSLLQAGCLEAYGTEGEGRPIANILEMDVSLMDNPHMVRNPLDIMLSAWCQSVAMECAPLLTGCLPRFVLAPLLKWKCRWLENEEGDMTPKMRLLVEGELLPYSGPRVMIGTPSHELS